MFRDVLKRNSLRFTECTMDDLISNDVDTRAYLSLKEIIILK